MVIEAFEASPLSEEVLATKAALQWDFPGSAVALSFSTFQDQSFQEELATFLEQASTESIKRFAARTNKAGSFAYESRDTVDPALITQMLMTLLETIGTRIYPTVLRKRVRDDVSWNQGKHIFVLNHLFLYKSSESQRAETNKRPRSLSISML